jgi:hypothetical protein
MNIQPKMAIKVFLSTPNPITMLAARRECGAVGADLASIHSGEENNFIKGGGSNLN